MLDKKEIKKVTELIEEGKSNYQIGKELNHSPNTIKHIREKNKKNEERQTQGEDVPYTNPIDKTRRIIAFLETFIQTEQLNDRDKKQLERLLEKLKEIIRVEVDDRISSERADAVEKRDQEWKKDIEQNYVKKEVARGLESTIQEKDATMLNLRKTIGEKNEEILQNQSNISILRSWLQQNENQTQDLVNENKALKTVNRELHNYIENRLDDTVGRDLEQLRYEQNVLNAEKTVFATNAENQRSNLNTLFFNAMEWEKTLEIREKQLAEREEKIQKREDELKTTRTKMNDDIQISVNALETRVEKVDMLEKDVKKWAYDQINEMNQERKKITDEQEQITKQ